MVGIDLLIAGINDASITKHTATLNSVELLEECGGSRGVLQTHIEDQVQIHFFLLTRGTTSSEMSFRHGFSPVIVF